MANYTANKVVKTLTIHKQDCHNIPWDNLKPCGCGPAGKKGNQFWWCEKHIQLDVLTQFLKKKSWAILLCEQCY